MRSHHIVEDLFHLFYVRAEDLGDVGDPPFSPHDPSLAVDGGLELGALLDKFPRARLGEGLIEVLRGGADLVCVLLREEGVFGIDVGKRL